MTTPTPADIPFIDVNVDNSGLRLRYRICGDKNKPLLILQHGARDHSRSWDFVAARLLDKYCVVTPDLRGHGDSDHVPGGGYGLLEMMTDFGAILDDLDRKDFSSPFAVIGHSLGGNIVTHYAAAYPEKIGLLINIEGVGTPPRLYRKMMERPSNERWREAAEKLSQKAGQSLRVFATPELAMRRMRQLHNKVPTEIVNHVARYAIREVAGGYSWKYDRLLNFVSHRPEAPDEYMQLYQSITCPVLLFYGGASFTTPPDRDERGQIFRDEKLIVYEDAGHWLHHERLNDFVRDILLFLGEKQNKVISSG